MNKRIVLIFISFFLIPFIVSCAPKHVEMPSYADVDLNSVISDLSNVTSIEAVMSMEYEKNNNLMNGDASLVLSEEHIDLKIYYLGFLAGYLKEQNGVVAASQKLDRNKSAILIEGLKNSFFWWKIDDYTIDDEEDVYKLMNFNRKIVISKKTMLPIMQTIELYNGDELKISYDSPARLEPEDIDFSYISPLISWYQSAMRIELNNHLLKIKIKSYNLKTKAASAQAGAIK